MDENNSGKLSLTVANKSKPHYVIFYTDSLVVVRLDPKFKKTTSKALTKQYKADKIPLLQRGKAVKQYWEDYATKYLSMTKQTALLDDNKNIEIKLNDIEDFKLKPHRTSTTNSYESDFDLVGQLWIKTSQKKYHYNHEYKIDNDKLTKLESLLGDKFIMKK